MKLGQARQNARGELERHDIEDASLEAEVLLRHVTGLDRARFYTETDRELSGSEAAEYRRLLERRIGGEPTAGITGHREFFGYDFIVNRDVLIPRPETELLVEEAITLCRNSGYADVADIGTGCGAIAISLARRLRHIRVCATDISAPALETARENCRQHGVADRVTLRQGDMLAALPEPADLICANLPYVREADIPPQGPLSHEPRLALDGGPDGLQCLELICRQAPAKIKPGGSILLEIGQGQAPSVTRLLDRAFPGGLIQVYRDLAGIERVVALRLTELHG